MTIAQLYAEGRGRITEVVREAGDAGADAPVPSCPGWSVRDVVAHLSGVCTDILAGNIAGVATDPWTDAQVSARRHLGVDAILDEWSEAAPQVEAFADNFPGQSGSQWVTDLTTHEHDIRATLGRAGARDSGGVAVGVEFLVTVGFHAGVSVRGLSPLEVRAGDRSWTVGTGDGSGLPDEKALEQAVTEGVATALLGTGGPPPAGEAAGTVEAPAFEIMRALTGRRSRGQIRGFRWSVDPEPYLPAFQFGPFTTSPSDVSE